MKLTEEQSSNNEEDLINYSPEDIALALFSQDPKDPCSHQILAYQEGTDLTYIFEILITILMEGLDYLAGNLNDVDLTKFDEEYITMLEPWLEMIVFKINVFVYDTDYYGKYYCKVILNTEENKQEFLSKKINKNYHFLLNGIYLDDNKNQTELNKLYCLFSINDLVYRISFDFYHLLDNNKQKME